MADMWANFRESSIANHDTFTLEDVDLPDAWVKLRKFSSYTAQELMTIDSMWIEKRSELVRDRMVEVLSENKKKSKSKSIKVVEGLLEVFDNMSSGREEDVSPEDREHISMFVRYSSMQKLLPFSGVEIDQIVEWNLTKMDDAKVVIPLPKEDIFALEALPMSVVWKIQELLALSRENAMPPKVRKLLSS